MSILIGPTKIKQSYYLLIPKNLADLIGIKENSKFTLTIQNTDKSKALEYRLK